MGEACYFTIWSGMRGLFANLPQKVTKIENAREEKAEQSKIKY